MRRGYVKLWRKGVDSDVWSSGPELWYLWSYIMMKACGKPRRIEIKKNGIDQRILLDSGQLFYSLSVMARNLSFKKRTLHKRLDKLVRLGMITTQTVYAEKQARGTGVVNYGTGALGSILTVQNWWKYQSRHDAQKNNEVNGVGEYNKEVTTVKNIKELHQYKENDSNSDHEWMELDDGRFINTITGEFSFEEVK